MNLRCSVPGRSPIDLPKAIGAIVARFKKFPNPFGMSVNPLELLAQERDKELRFGA
jgi:hypothetical protein